MTSGELLLHPVRLRVAQALLGGRALTTAALRDELADVAPATLYRHVATLLEAGVLEVAEERQVRGAVQRTYRLRAAAASVTAEDAAAMSVEDHRRGFMAFTAGLLADFDRYLDAGDVDLGRDLVGYRQAALHLSDEEMREFLADLVEVVRPRLEVPPGEGRTRRLFTTVVMPALTERGSRRSRRTSTGRRRPAGPT